MSNKKAYARVALFERMTIGKASLKNKKPDERKLGPFNLSLGPNRNNIFGTVPPHAVVAETKRETILAVAWAPSRSDRPPAANVGRLVFFFFFFIVVSEISFSADNGQTLRLARQQ